MFTDTTFLQNYVRSPHRSGILHQLSHVILRYWEELELAKQKAIIAELEQLRVRITYDYANANRLAAVALEIKHGAPGYPVSLTLQTSFRARLFDCAVSVTNLAFARS